MGNTEENKKKIDLRFVNIWRPISWQIIKASENKLVNDDVIYKMQVGNYCDELPIYAYMSKANFELLLTGKALYKFYLLNDYVYLYLVNGINKKSSLVNGTKLDDEALNAIKETDEQILRLTESKK